jgi:hypothetical protein
MGINLRFVNNSNEVDNQSIVVFQKNESTGDSEIPLAWLVIEGCGQNAYHPFVYPTTMQVSAGDSQGNFMPNLNAQPGQSFELVESDSGNVLQPNGDAGFPTEIDLCNNLSMGSIDAWVFKAKRKLARKTDVVPGDKASFKFLPKLWIGAVSQIVEGDVMDSAVVDQINTNFDLTGIASADIVMTGGGIGPTAKGNTFQLKNVVRV